MKKRITIFGLAAIGLSFPALAQGGPPADPYGDATVTRADELAGGAPAGGPGGRGGRGPGGRADADGDGKVSKDEYTSAQLRRFDMQDANKDGSLTKEERDAARAQRQRGPGGGGWGGPPPNGEGGGWGSSGGE